MKKAITEVETEDAVLVRQIAARAVGLEKLIGKQLGKAPSELFGIFHSVAATGIFCFQAARLWADANRIYGMRQA